MIKGKGGTLLDLAGTVERVVFYSEADHFAVARLKEANSKKEITIVGHLTGITPGQSLKVKGRWEEDGKYGAQFRVEALDIEMPQSLEGIERYLGSGLIKGLGPVMAKRIVSKFGMEALKVIEESPKRLKEVEGIGQKRLGIIQASFDEQKEIRDVMVFFQGHGISPAYSLKIYKHYGQKAMEILMSNPYSLCADVYGIGFKIADSIAMNMGIEPTSLLRAEAGIIYVLQKQTEEGHLYLPREELLKHGQRELGIDVSMLEEALRSLKDKGSVVVEDDAVYERRLFMAEVEVAQALTQLKAMPKPAAFLDMEEGIKEIEAKEGLSLSIDQGQALRKVMTEKVLVVTGGPGTGKTTLVKSIALLTGRLGLRLALAAPTGRAAKHMAEASGHEARTLHRLLEFNPGTFGFMRDEANPINAHLVVIDEASMLDLPLMHSLLKAIPRDASLLLVGDKDQLPSVGPGNVLKDIIDSNSFEVVFLKEVFRQSQRSLMVTNAHRINQGQFPILKHEDNERDFFHIEREDPEETLATLKELLKERMPKSFGLDPVDDIQVLCPMHRGLIGVHNLNLSLQELLNPFGQELPLTHKKLRLFDKVMQVRNNYTKEVFNGDIGRVERVDAEEQRFWVNFDGRLVPYEFHEADELNLAYCLSVHKSQGSEYPAVVLLLLPQHFLLLQRNLLYTASTRAKRLLVLLGSKKAVAMAIKNDQVKKRYSQLASRIANLLKG